MKDAVKKVSDSTINFVKKHKTPIVAVIAVATTAVAAKKLHDGAVSDLREFMEEKDLTDTYDTWIAEKTIDALNN